MRLAVVYNPNDHKLLPSAYSWTYRDMFMAVLDRFAPVIHVTGSCEAQTIEADAILFWDVHSCHHIEIKDIDKHPAVKIEYFNDPHQIDQTLRVSGQIVHKLGAKERCERAKQRGVTKIICPYRNGLENYIEPFADGMELLWFPVAPKPRRRVNVPLSLRRAEVLASGNCWPGENGFHPYEFRRWAYAESGLKKQMDATHQNTPIGPAFQAYLAQFAGALALCDTYVVPKYLEIPMAGGVCVCQMLSDYEAMGFKDGENCLAVDKTNFIETVQAVMNDPAAYQSIADAGREWVLNQYTADHFAEWLKKQLTSE